MVAGGSLRTPSECVCEARLVGVQRNPSRISILADFRPTTRWVLAQEVWLAVESFINRCGVCCRNEAVQSAGFGGASEGGGGGGGRGGERLHMEERQAELQVLVHSV